MSVAPGSLLKAIGGPRPHIENFLLSLPSHAVKCVFLTVSYFCKYGWFTITVSNVISHSCRPTAQKKPGHSSSVKGCHEGS